MPRPEWTAETHACRPSTRISRGLPPTFIQIGSAETLLDDAVRLASAAGAADVSTTLEIWPHMIHAWPLWNARLEPGRRALAHAGAFLRQNL